MSIRAFVLNWLGAKVPEDQMRNIEHPRMEVQGYVAMKCMQIGAVVGYAYALRIPIMRYLGRPVVPPLASRLDMTRSVMRSTRNGMVGGLFASVPVAMVYANQHRLTDESYYRRAYELRHNKRQLNVDRGSLLIGLGVGAFYKFSYGFPLSLGFSTGMALGSAVLFLYNNYDWLYRRAEEKEVEIESRTKSVFDQLTDKAHEQVDHAKGSLRKVSQQAQDRVEDAKGSIKKTAEDTKDKFRHVSDEGKDSLKKASDKMQDYGQDLQDLKAKAKENAQDFKNKAKDNVNEIKNKAKENANDFKNKAKDNVNELKNKAKDNVNDFKNSSE